MKNIEAFFLELDDKWPTKGGGRIRLSLIGSSALFLQTDYDRGTKDSDVLETEQLKRGAGVELTTLAGQGSALHRRHRLYIDIVASGLPFLPHPPIFHFLSISKKLKHFDVHALDVVDIAVSKLIRFNANDASDIRAMVEIGAIKHRILIERFRSAVDSFSMDARVEDLPKYIANLHAIERDFLRVPETLIDLPEWM